MARQAFDEIIHAELDRASVTHVALAGYMRLLSPEFVGKWQGRMVNIHPSLLPLHKGLHVHEGVLAAGETVSGCTVHLVTAELDDGPTLGQTRVAVLPGDTPDTLAARILIAEHQLYPRVLAALVGADTDPGATLAKVRELALALPEAEEKLSPRIAGLLCQGRQVLRLLVEGPPRRRHHRGAGQGQRRRGAGNADRAGSGPVLPPGLSRPLGLDRHPPRYRRAPTGSISKTG